MLIFKASKLSLLTAWCSCLLLFTNFLLGPMPTSVKLSKCLSCLCVCYSKLFGYWSKYLFFCPPTPSVTLCLIFSPSVTLSFSPSVTLSFFLFCFLFFFFFSSPLSLSFPLLSLSFFLPSLSLLSFLSLCYSLSSLLPTFTSFFLFSF